MIPVRSQWGRYNLPQMKLPKKKSHHPSGESRALHSTRKRTAQVPPRIWPPASSNPRHPEGLTSYPQGPTNSLVGGIPTPLKNMSSSVGMMILPNMNGKVIIQMFQTTNQFCNVSFSPANFNRSSPFLTSLRDPEGRPNYRYLAAVQIPVLPSCVGFVY